MSTHPHLSAPVPPLAPAAQPSWRPPGASVATVWVLRVLTGLQAVLLTAQPVLAGRFLDGHYPALAAHGTNGLALAALAWLVVAAAVLTWRPGRLPARPVAVALAVALLLPTQLGMGYARVTTVHLGLGVALVGTGVALAVWAWRPGRVRRSYRAAAAAPGAAAGSPR